MLLFCPGQKLLIVHSVDCQWPTVDNLILEVPVTLAILSTHYQALITTSEKLEHSSKYALLATENGILAIIYSINHQSLQPSVHHQLSNIKHELAIIWGWVTINQPTNRG